MSIPRELSVVPAAAIIAALGGPLIFTIASIPSSLPLNLAEFLSSALAAMAGSFIFGLPIIMIGLLLTVVPVGILMRRKIGRRWHLPLFALVGFAAGGVFLSVLFYFRSPAGPTFDFLGASYGCFAAVIWSLLLHRRVAVADSSE